MSEKEKELEENIEERNYTQEIFDIIRKTKNKKLLNQLLSNYHDNDIADTLVYLTPAERQNLYQAIGVEATSDIFAYLGEDVEPYIAELETVQAAQILEEMDTDDAIDILEELDENKAKEIMAHIDQETREDIRLIQSYSDDQFGSLMTTNYITIKYGISRKDAMNELMEQAQENDNIETLYVVKDNDEFYGALTLRDLLITKNNESLDDKIILSYPFVYDKEEITEEAIDTLMDYSEDSIPVIEKETNRILGVLTSQDLVELVDTQAEEDEAENEIVMKKSFNSRIFMLVGFVLLMLLSLNKSLNVLPQNSALEWALMASAAILEAYGLFRNTQNAES